MKSKTVVVPIPRGPIEQFGPSTQVEAGAVKKTAHDHDRMD
jgi:hypothetical protein